MSVSETDAEWTYQ